MTVPVTEIHKIEEETEKSLAILFHTTVAEVAKGAIERSRDSAKYVQTAAAAVNALYVGALALVFSVTDNPLPLRGLFATMFLAAAVALSTAYLAFLSQPSAPPLWNSGASMGDNQIARTGWLTNYVNSAVLHRRQAIRSSVLALGFGVLFIPAPFLSLTRAPKVPEAPTPPAIPAAVATPVAPEATKLFVAQVDAFNVATEKRAEALKESENLNDREGVLNVSFAGLALVAAIVTWWGPKHLGNKEDKLPTDVTAETGPFSPPGVR